MGGVEFLPEEKPNEKEEEPKPWQRGKLSPFSEQSSQLLVSLERLGSWFLARRQGKRETPEHKGSSHKGRSGSGSLSQIRFLVNVKIKNGDQDYIGLGSYDTDILLMVIKSAT